MASETGKQRSQRIQIDYYRRRTGLHQLKSACVIAGLVGAGLYAVYVLAAGGGSHLSTGPVALAHAAFENDCKECHQDFTPIDARGSRLDWKLVGLDSTEAIAQIESACQKCHPVGDHHRDVMNAEWQLDDQNCPTCHADHKGRDNNLVAVWTGQCTSCHANLADGRAAEPKVRANVAAFNDQQHGDFASLTEPDPGVVKFDHAQHMRLGQVNNGEKGAFTVGMLDPSLRDRYQLKGQDDSSPVALDCSSCHEFDGNPARIDSLPFDNELGRYMAPISFDKHCSACHSMNPGVATPDTTPLPHAVAWSKIDLLLAASLQGARATGQARALRDDTQSTPQPGEGPGNPAPSHALDSAAQIAMARKLVEGQCLQCHDAASITDEAIAVPTSDPMIPARWLTHGLYHHGIHRQIDCRYCHEDAYRADDSPKPPSDHQTVMIAGIDTCTGCHRDADLPTPASISSPEVKALLGDQSTWASDSCTLCHRYHTRRDRGIGSMVSASAAEANP
jgi:hypothetical protein